MKKLALVVLLVACEEKVVAPPEPAPVVASASASESPPEPAPEPEPIVEDDEWYGVVKYDNVVGRWIGAEHGDAIPKGPAGGTIVNGGLRVEIVKGRKGSKTPWNLTFWAPREGHLGSDTISGGCGFYPYNPKTKSSAAFCRGYGLDGDGATKTSLIIEGTGEDGRLRITIEKLIRMRVRR